MCAGPKQQKVRKGHLSLTQNATVCTFHVSTWGVVSVIVSSSNTIIFEALKKFCDIFYQLYETWKQYKKVNIPFKIIFCNFP